MSLVKSGKIHVPPGGLSRSEWDSLTLEEQSYFHGAKDIRADYKALPEAREAEKASYDAGFRDAIEGKPEGPSVMESVAARRAQEAALPPALPTRSATPKSVPAVAVIHTAASLAAKARALQEAAEAKGEVLGNVAAVRQVYEEANLL
jgi:hypothetical protein